MSDYEKLKPRVLEFEESLRGNDRAAYGQFGTLVHDLWNEIEWLRSQLGAISDGPDTAKIKDAMNTVGHSADKLKDHLGV